MKTGIQCVRKCAKSWWCTLQDYPCDVTFYIIFGQRGNFFFIFYLFTLSRFFGDIPSTNFGAYTTNVGEHLIPKR